MTFADLLRSWMDVPLDTGRAPTPAAIIDAMARDRHYAGTLGAYLAWLQGKLLTRKSLETPFDKLYAQWLDQGVRDGTLNRGEQLDPTSTDLSRLHDALKLRFFGLLACHITNIKVENESAAINKAVEELLKRRNLFQEIIRTQLLRRGDVLPFVDRNEKAASGYLRGTRWAENAYINHFIDKAQEEVKKLESFEQVVDFFVRNLPRLETNLKQQYVNFLKERLTSAAVLQQTFLDFQSDFVKTHLASYQHGRDYVEFNWLNVGLRTIFLKQLERLSIPKDLSPEEKQRRIRAHFADNHNVTAFFNIIFQEEEKFGFTILPGGKWDQFWAFIEREATISGRLSYIFNDPVKKMLNEANSFYDVIDIFAREEFDASDVTQSKYRTLKNFIEYLRGRLNGAPAFNTPLTTRWQGFMEDILHSNASKFDEKDMWALFKELKLGFFNKLFFRISTDIEVTTPEKVRETWENILKEKHRRDPFLADWLFLRNDIFRLGPQPFERELASRERELKKQTGKKLGEWVVAQIDGTTSLTQVAQLVERAWIHIINHGHEEASGLDKAARDKLKARSREFYYVWWAFEKEEDIKWLNDHSAYPRGIGTLSKAAYAEPKNKELEEILENRKGHGSVRGIFVGASGLIPIEKLFEDTVPDTVDWAKFPVLALGSALAHKSDQNTLLNKKNIGKYARRNPEDMRWKWTYMRAPWAEKEKEEVAAHSDMIKAIDEMESWIGRAVSAGIGPGESLNWHKKDDAAQFGKMMTDFQKVESRIGPLLRTNRQVATIHDELKNILSKTKKYYDDEYSGEEKKSMTTYLKGIKKIDLYRRLEWLLEVAKKYEDLKKAKS